MDLTVRVDHLMKIKENEKIDKYTDLARVLKMLRKIRVKIIAIVVETASRIQ